MKQFALTLILSVASLPALAGVPAPLPEPGVLPLLAVGAVGGLVLWARKRRKK